MLDDLKLDTVDLRSHLRRAAHRADGAAVEVSESAGQRLRRHRGRHGHQSIPPHNLGEVCDCIDPRDRRAGRLDRRTAGNLPRPRFSHRRHHLRPQRHPPRLSHRPQHDHAARPDQHRRTRQRPLPHRRQRNALPADPRSRSKKGSPSWSTKTGSWASRPAATKAI